MAHLHYSFEASEMLVNVEGDDPLGLAADLETIQPSPLLLSPFLVPREDSNNIDLENLSGPGARTEYGYRSVGNLPLPGSGYDMTNEPWFPEHAVARSVPVQGYGASNHWPYYSRPSAVTVPTETRTLQSEHPGNPSWRNLNSNMAGSTASPNLSYTAPWSPSGFGQGRQAFEPSLTSSTGPTEVELPVSQQEFGEAGEDAGAGAGFDMVWMEGFADANPERPQHYQPPYDPTLPPLDDGFDERDAMSRRLHRLAARPHQCLGLQCWCFNGQPYACPLAPVALDDDILDPNKPVVVADRASSTKFEGTVPGSFPPTEGHYPKTAVPKRRYRTVSAPQSSSNVGRRRRSTNRKRGNSVSSTGGNAPLTAIGEETEAVSPRGWATPLEEEALHTEETIVSQTMQRTASGKARGRRTDKLAEEVRHKAARNRREKTVCTNCKAAKQSCDGHHPCERCRKNGKQCVLAEFQQYVSSSQCNSLFHRSIVHQDHIEMGYLPEMIDGAALLKVLGCLRSEYRLLVSTATSSSYLLDLGTCYDLLLRVEKPVYQLAHIFDQAKRRPVSLDWLNAVKDYEDPGLSVPDRFAKWCLLPCRNTYQLVPYRGTSSPKSLSMELLGSAATLNRIALRALELVTHDVLQKKCKDMLKTSCEIEAPGLVALVQELGKIACSLRLRHAWEQAFGDHGPLDAADVMAPTTRVANVARSYYDYYLRALKKRQREPTVGLNLSNQQNYTKVDDKLIFDPFPVPGSQGSFEDWLGYGLVVLQQAGIA
ncbi:MAG: hypothetical protein Q9163_002292 [Psora crenata]